MQQRLTSLINSKLYKDLYRNIAVFAVPLIIFLLILAFSLTNGQNEQFSDLAQAFVHGHTNFLHSIGGVGHDPIIWHGKYYWPEEPFPALLLAPFVAFFNIFHHFFYQGYIQWALILGVLFFVFKIASILGYSRRDSLILTLGFSLGSVFIGVAGISDSWFFAQVVTTFLLFWAFYEFYTSKRWWLIGIICGLVLITRASAAPIFIFFALELWQSVRPAQKRLAKLVLLSLPAVLALVLLGLYNFVRFGNAINGGYHYQLLDPTLARARSYGLFSPLHIPGNLYAFILGTPVPFFRDNVSHVLTFPYVRNNPWGMSIFINSPYLLYLFTLKRSAIDSRARNLIIATLISCLMVFSWFSIGFAQYGYRYALDFLPGVFILFMIKYRENHPCLSRGMKTLLLGSGLVNFYLFLTFVL